MLGLTIGLAFLTLISSSLGNSNIHKVVGQREFDDVQICEQTQSWLYPEYLTEEGQRSKTLTFSCDAAKEGYDRITWASIELLSHSDGDIKRSSGGVGEDHIEFKVSNVPRQSLKVAFQAYAKKDQ